MHKLKNGWSLSEDQVDVVSYMTYIQKMAECFSELKQSLWSNLQNLLRPQEFKLELLEYGGDPLKTLVQPRFRVCFPFVLFWINHLTIFIIYVISSVKAYTCGYLFSVAKIYFACPACHRFVIHSRLIGCHSNGWAYPFEKSSCLNSCCYLFEKVFICSNGRGFPFQKNVQLFEQLP